MSSEEPIIKNSKFVKAINNMNEESEYDQNYFDSEDEYFQQERDDELFEQAIYNIKQELMQYIDDKSLPLAEFLTFGKLKKFIIKEILY